MRKLFEGLKKKFFFSQTAKSEEGAALVVALLVLMLLMAFVAVVVSRVSVETILTSNDSALNRSQAAAQASLESTSRDFADVFQRKLSPTSGDVTRIQNTTVPGFTGYDFTKTVRQTRASQATEITGGSYSGMYSLRDEWEIDVTARDRATGVESQLRRRILNDRIPLFQFGMFFEDDLELNRPPLFTFGGRVHTNRNLFVSAYPVSASPAGGIYFRSKVTAVGEIVNDIWKTGSALTSGTDNQNGVFVADAGGVLRELRTGVASANCVSPSGTNVFAYDNNLPVCSRRSNWSTDKQIFQGNLDTNTPRLDLPLYRLYNDPYRLIEIIRRGKNVGDMHNSGGSIVQVDDATKDNDIVAVERFANKPGLRISLADAKTRLPGCAASVTATDDCGVRLDRQLGTSSIGYQPLPMQDSSFYKTTAFNASRFAQSGKEIWIKIELVDFNYDTGAPVTKDITQDILSLGVTESAPVNSTDFQIAGYASNTDSRSIVKLQRFAIPGPAIPNPGDISTTFLTSRSIGGVNHNLVVRKTSVTGTALDCDKSTGTNSNAFAPASAPSSSGSSSSQEDAAHLYCARFSGTGNYTNIVAPFPIKIFDTREGIPNDSATTTGSFGADKVPRAGVMSLIDIDVRNLRQFLNGSFNGRFPTSTPFAVAKGSGQSLTSTDVPENKGWVVYVSDRRGDADFDGEYDMEDVFPDLTLQFNEDLNGNSVLNRLIGTEAPGYTDWFYRSQAAASDHGYYRRGVRLINGSVVPGIYDAAAPGNTRGFTLASENGVYVFGNYNATGVGLTGTTAPAPSQNYLPQNTSEHIPAAIVADAVMILSNGWQDAKSFATPFTPNSRVATATVVRFAMLSGDGITGKNTATSYNPSNFGQLNGGVHNFKRYLETWTNVRLNYAGSLVNLYNSRNNNGFFKCCNAVYNPPIRDWTFDSTFLDPNRLPPGTPYIYTMTFTGFQRVND